MSQIRPRVGRYLRQHHLALLALFVALGGSSYAAFRVPSNSIGARQLEDNSVTTNKIKNGAVTGSKVSVRTLGRVPAAVAATTAKSASTSQNAVHATNADSATNATNAGSASNAAHASNADQLGGAPPSAFLDRCPPGTTLAAAAICVTTSDVGTAGSGQNTWFGAILDCAALGLHLPSPAEAALTVSSTPVNLGYWTDSTNGTNALEFTHDSNTPAGRVNPAGENTDHPVRCVTTPRNT